MRAMRITVCLLLAFLVSCSGGESEPEPDPDPEPLRDAVTYAEDVRPLNAQHCQACHTDDGSGPFSLDSYDDVKAFARGKDREGVIDLRTALEQDRVVTRVVAESAELEPGGCDYAGGHGREQDVVEHPRRFGRSARGWR